jgi:hypothetical protein
VPVVCLGIFFLPETCIFFFTRNKKITIKFVFLIILIPMTDCTSTCLIFHYPSFGLKPLVIVSQN